MTRFKYGEVYIMKLLTMVEICKKIKPGAQSGFYSIGRGNLVIENVSLDTGT